MPNDPTPPPPDGYRPRPMGEMGKATWVELWMFAGRREWVVEGTKPAAASSGPYRTTPTVVRSIVIEDGPTGGTIVYLGHLDGTVERIHEHTRIRYIPVMP